MQNLLSALALVTAHTATGHWVHLRISGKTHCVVNTDTAIVAADILGRKPSMQVAQADMLFHMTCIKIGNSAFWCVYFIVLKVSETIFILNTACIFSPTANYSE